MFKHILVPVNFSENNKQALDIAVKLAIQDNARITVIHVIEVIEDTTPDEFREFYTALEERAQTDMDNLLGPYSGNKVEFMEKIIFGNRTEKIIACALTETVDLIIMNSHKIDLADPSHGWGTISYKVGILSQCPVMLVK